MASFGGLPQTGQAAVEGSLSPVSREDAGLRDALQAGLSGRYIIERALGHGGMAVVFLAEDARNARKVALKVLDPTIGLSLAVERFLAEVRVTAALTHPNILPLFDSGVAAGFLFYATPFVEGDSLRQRLQRDRQLPLSVALRIAGEVGEALGYAHRNGVVHRDVKPENILLADGHAVVADFGIARAIGRAAWHGEASLTATGIRLGTPAYMSPEQSAGDHELDGRSDVYALGCVLYEMLAGVPPFAGPTPESVLRQHVAAPAPLVTQLRPEIPAAIAQVVARALAKTPADRFDTASDFAEALRQRAAVDEAASVFSQPRQTLRFSLRLSGAGLVLGLLLGAGASRWWTPWLESKSAGAVMRAEIDLPPEAPIAFGTNPNAGYNSPVIALSPDGGTLIYVAATPGGEKLYVRDMASGQSRALAGTEGALHPFFSPDGQWIGFLTAGYVKKVPLRGGSATTICAATQPVLARWIGDTIWFTDGETYSLTKVPASGARPQKVMGSIDIGVGRFADILPDGQILAESGGSIGGDYHDILLVDVATKRTRVLVHNGFGARYVAPGYLLFGRGGSLMAMSYDLRRGVAAGEPVTIADGAAMESLFGIVHATGSATGVLAYVPGADLSVGKLAWVDRRGATRYIPAPEQVYGAVGLSPGSERLAVVVADVRDYDLIWDLVRSEGRRIDVEWSATPRWSPDGKQFALLLRDGSLLVHDVSPSGGIGGAHQVGDVSALGAIAWSIPPAVRRERSTPGYVYFLSPSGTPDSVQGYFPTFSPDRRALAHVSRLAAGSAVVLESYPDHIAAGQVSDLRGGEPRWKASGDLYFRIGHRWYVTHPSTRPQLRWDPPRLVFETDKFIDTPGLSYDVSDDGTRLLIVERAHPLVTSRVEIITNWPELLHRTR